MREKKPKILIVNPDAPFRKVLKELFGEEFDIINAKHGVDGLDKFKKNKPDVCILETALSSMDGVTLTAEIRKINKKVPILLLVSKFSKKVAINGYKAGADDYMDYDYDLDLLRLKVDAIVRHIKYENRIDYSQDIVSIGDYTLNKRLRFLYYKNEDPIKLFVKEAQLIALLIHHKDDLLPRKLCLERMWGDINFYTNRSLDVILNKVRKVLKKDERIKILSIMGEGYRMYLEEQKAPEQESF